MYSRTSDGCTVELRLLEVVLLLPSYIDWDQRFAITLAHLQPLPTRLTSGIILIPSILPRTTADGNNSRESVEPKLHGGEYCTLPHAGQLFPSYHTRPKPCALASNLPLTAPFIGLFSFLLVFRLLLHPHQATHSHPRSSFSLHWNVDKSGSIASSLVTPFCCYLHLTPRLSAAAGTTSLRQPSSYTPARLQVCRP